MNNTTFLTTLILSLVYFLVWIFYIYVGLPNVGRLGKLTFIHEPIRTTCAMKGNSNVSNVEALQSSPYFFFRGGFRIGHNIVKSSKIFVGNESITLTTTADFTYLDNLVTLAERWQGPISCSLFTPGSDFYQTLEAIHYLHECTSPMIKQLVSFHVYFPIDHIPANLTHQSWASLESHNHKRDCNNKFKFGKKVQTYRKLKNLLYYINIGRNIARDMAQTHFVLPLDIELYPSTNVISEFFQIVANKKNEQMINSLNPKVFVLPVFQLHQNMTTLPNRKEELKKLLQNKLANTYHQHECKFCHRIPDGWFNYTGDSNASTKGVFSVTKRMKGQIMWEPFYIGTKSDPEFDERVTWEGRSDKRVQAYALCLLDYDFYILSNVFVVHRPGIQFLSHKNKTLEDQMNQQIGKVIVPELQAIYGQRKGCQV